METDLLYQTDSYLRNFIAKVTGIDREMNAIMLDKTVFYPGGGGQPHDTGRIHFSGITSDVVKVLRNAEVVWHAVEGEIPEKKQPVQCEIDWERRYKLMRTHTAMHILCGVIWRDYGAKVTGGNMEPLKARMDFEFENMSSDLVEEIEQKVNEEVENARDVEVDIISREEANKIPNLVRTKINLLPDNLTEIRTVNIKGLDLQADGGTHVKNTREVGRINIMDYKSKGKINKRLRISLDESP